MDKMINLWVIYFVSKMAVESVFLPEDINDLGDINFILIFFQGYLKILSYIGELVLEDKGFRNHKITL